MQDIANSLIAALAAHNWLLLTTIIASLLLMIAHIPAIDAWMGAQPVCTAKTAATSFTTIATAGDTSIYRYQF